MDGPAVLTVPQARSIPQQKALLTIGLHGPSAGSGSRRMPKSFASQMRAENKASSSQPFELELDRIKRWLPGFSIECQ
jgi:hypothetical protein